jgi:predicted RND superfamily exporter protein
MRARLAETRSLLLAPGAGSLVESLTIDPLRLGSLAMGEGATSRSGLPVREDGRLATAGGEAALVLVESDGGAALRSDDARAVRSAIDDAIAAVTPAHPRVRFGATGPHVIASQIEAMIRRDLRISGAASLGLAALAFGLVFGRWRALLAIVPPLALGTLWTAGLVALWPRGVSAVAAAFVSVVVGVGFDTGVHVHAAVLEAKREGIAPDSLARVARRRVARPVLGAAAIAAAAFGSLVLSEVSALGQLGVLSAAGELATALAILLVTPELSARLEARAVLPPTRTRLGRAIARATSTRGRALGVVGLASVVAVAGFCAGIEPASALVAVRPSGVDAFDVERRVAARFGDEGRLLVVFVEDASRDAALARLDRVAEGLASHPELAARVDASTAFAPAPATRARRLAELDPARCAAWAESLATALRANGFASARFEPALAALRAPALDRPSKNTIASDVDNALSNRYVAEHDGRFYAQLRVSSVAPAAQGELPDRALLELVAGLDSGARVTGYPRLEPALRSTLARELPTIGAFAGVLVAGLLALTLRRPRALAIALTSLVVGVGTLLAAFAVLRVQLHLYSALVLPALLGVTIDEAMFVLGHARDPQPGDSVERALAREAVPVTTTALTTSAGFAALGFARYDALRDLGLAGALGNAVMLLTALFVVPALLRWIGVDPIARASPSPEDARGG